jgi:predicted  nucleic acid-binding Zn-ribbon protein
MGIFDFFGNRKENLSENVAALEQKLQSLEQEFLSETKRGKELKLQNDDLAHQIEIKQNEVSKLQRQRDSLSEETTRLNSTQENLLSLLQKSTQELKSIPSSTVIPLVDLNSKYLIAMDEDDYRELSAFYTLRAKVDSLAHTKEELEKELHRSEEATKAQEDRQSTLQRQFDLIQQQVTEAESKRDECISQLADLKRQIDLHKAEQSNLQHYKELIKREVCEELDEKIEKKEEDLDYLDYRLRDTENRLNLAVCELNNLEAVKDLDTSIIWKENPSKEEMEQAVKAYNILRFRYDLVSSWMKRYEKDLEMAKSNLDLFIKERRDEIRNELIHEMYQRASQCESSMLRHLSSFVENADIEEIREQLKIHKHTIKLGLRVSTEDSVIKYPLHPIYNMCEDYIQLNIANIVKDMKYSDWETIKMKVSTLISNIDHLLMSYTDTHFDDDYLKSVYNYIEAKYLVVQKQEEEREEREAQREYERAIKKALKDEEKAQEALEQKKREMAETQTQEKIQKLQEQIQGLEKALVEARELRERAMSMAQQTKIGYVYVISNIGSFGKDVYKIGMTRRLDPMERVLELSNASVPFPFDVHTFIYSEDAPALEADLHRRFDAKKVNSINYRKEYFHVTLDEIKAALEEKGVDAQFVDEPDAFQYRESLVKEQQQNSFHFN